MCYDESGLCAQNLITILVFNSIHHNWESQCDHFKKKENLYIGLLYLTLHLMKLNSVDSENLKLTVFVRTSYLEAEKITKKVSKSCCGSQHGTFYQPHCTPQLTSITGQDRAIHKRFLLLIKLTLTISQHPFIWS